MLFNKQADPANELVSVSLKTLIDLAKPASQFKFASQLNFVPGKAALMCPALKVAAWSLMKPDYINQAMIFAVSIGESRRVPEKPIPSVFREERERPVFISVDNRLAMHFATRGVFKSVLAAKLAGLLAWAAEYHGDRIGGQIFSEHECRELKPQNGTHAVLRFLNALVKPQNPLDKAVYSGSGFGKT